MDIEKQKGNCKLRIVRSFFLIWANSGCWVTSLKAISASKLFHQFDWWNTSIRSIFFGFLLLFRCSFMVCPFFPRWGTAIVKGKHIETASQLSSSSTFTQKGEVMGESSLPNDFGSRFPKQTCFGAEPRTTRFWHRTKVLSVDYMSRWKFSLMVLCWDRLTKRKEILRSLLFAWGNTSPIELW